MKGLLLTVALVLVARAAALPFDFGDFFDSTGADRKIVRRSAQFANPVSNPVNSPAFGVNVGKNSPGFDNANPVFDPVNSPAFGVNVGKNSPNLAIDITSNLVEPPLVRDRHFDVRFDSQPAQQEITGESHAAVDAIPDTTLDTQEPLLSSNPSDSVAHQEQDAPLGFEVIPENDASRIPNKQGGATNVPENINDYDQTALDDQNEQTFVNPPTVQKQVYANENSQDFAADQSSPNVFAYPGAGSSFDSSATSISNPAEFLNPMDNTHVSPVVLPFSDWTPTQYTALDLSQVDFSADAAATGHKEYLSVFDSSGEQEIYQLLGVAPKAAAQGGAAQTYSASMGESVPVYREIDDDDFYWQMAGLKSNAAQFYSAALAGSQLPMPVKAKATLAGQQVVFLLDD